MDNQEVENTQDTNGAKINASTGQNSSMQNSTGQNSILKS